MHVEDHCSAVNCAEKYDCKTIRIANLCFACHKACHCILIVVTLTKATSSD